MKKLIIYLVSVLALVVLIDVVLGIGLDSYIRTHRLPGDSESIDYTLKDLDEEVVILGNSVVLNSLMPDVLTDSLGLSVYNSASNGQELNFFKTLLDAMVGRGHRPKVVVLGLRDNLFTTEGIGSRYSILTPYYGMGYAEIDSTLNSVSPYEKYFNRSTLYRYNTIWWRLLLYQFISPNEKGENGFIAKPIPPYPPKKGSADMISEPRPERLAQLKDIIETCRREKIQLVGIFPPIYTDRSADTKITAEVKRQFAEAGFPILDNQADAFFLAHPEYFFDETHLNKDGALIYSRETASKLKHLMEKK